MSKLLRAVASCVLLTAAQLAHAVPSAGWTTSDGYAYGTSLDFDGAGQLAANTLITNQFQAQGVTFSGSVRANACGYGAWSAYGMPMNSLGTYGPDCSNNAQEDSFAIRFDGTVSKLALDAFLDDRQGTASFDLYLKGQLVSSFSLSALAYGDLAWNTTINVDNRYFSNGPYGRAGILRVDGALFDEIRFAENLASGSAGFLFFDNLRFDAAREVPEPASLGLIALGLAGISALRRKPGATRQA
ncbi:PEP-CTERM sorting domain-containing protein [Massilia sp. 9I]|uniref:PEP-CTERM sorting domain-containing protein n=1 Tax=Massilia sp. 9I TaxID=2653152 RepID=UPI0012EFAFC8|nr:PEP-CTERM sorting domain-containing protein [Massilia sp. 9I]VXB33531.1 conserved exported hypothetical protein [Massilia sp. 9I]